MSTKEKVSIHSMVNFLNDILKTDRNAVRKLCFDRVSCNEDLANHPTVQVCEDNIESKKYSVGLLGFLNGIFGIGTQRIAAVLEESDDEIIKEFIIIETENEKSILEQFQDNGSLLI